MKGALAGIRVLDFTTLLPGPLATLFMADAGAEIIKVERPLSGDEMRSYSPSWGGDSANFHLLNRGKKSVTLDLRSAASLETLWPLIESADVLVEQFRPSVMKRLGLSYESVRLFNPKIIYCSITGYGQTGPKAKLAGHDLNYQADVGILSLGATSSGIPVVPPSLTADLAGGTYPALVNILLALLRRDQTGEGAYLDIAITQNLFPMLYWALGEGQATGNFPGPGESLVTGGSPRYRLYAAADQHIVAVAALEDKFWARFADAIGLEEIYRNDLIDPSATVKQVTDILKSKTGDYWAEIFARADCCCSLVKTLPQAMKDDHYSARGVFSRQIVVGSNDEVVQALPTVVAHCLQPVGNEKSSAPRLGQDNETLLGTSQGPER